MRVVMAIARTWDVEIPLDAFVAAPTPAHLASLIAAGGAVTDVRSRCRAAHLGRSSAAVPGPPDRRKCPVLSRSRQAPSGRSAGLRVAGGRCRARRDAAPHDERLGRRPTSRRFVGSHPDGPYSIGGWSFGGYVAVEMARQLADEELARLILLDTIALGDGPSCRGI